jgi:hypothetical protein
MITTTSQSPGKVWMLLGGALSILVGFFAISAPALFSYVITAFIGALCLVSGVIGLFQALFGKDVPHRILSALSAVIRLAAGSALFVFTESGMATLTLILGAVFFCCINIIMKKEIKYVPLKHSDLTKRGGDRISIFAEKLKVESPFGTVKGPVKLDKKQKARDDAAMSKGKRQVKLAFTEGEKESRQQEQLMKANKERLSFFEGLKKKFGGKSLGNTLGGPLFGNMDLIFDSVKHIFYIISIILTIAGIISLPVMIFLIITYTIMKAMVAKFTVL